MKVLGISLGHDSNVCLVEDGRIVRYAAEERFNRIKCGVNNAFESVRFCLGDTDIKDVRIAISDLGGGNTVPTHFRALFKAQSTTGAPIFLKEKGFQVDNVSEFPHHDCHAASAYFTSGFRDALLVTVDGIGGDTTQFVSEGNNGKVRPLEYVKKDGAYKRGLDGVFRVRKFKTPKAFSWGWFYGMVTEAIGFRMCTDEGKTMGLAPYGDPAKVPLSEMREHMYAIDPAGYYHDAGKVHYHFGGSVKYKALAEKYGKENVAAAAQKMLEDKIVRFVGYWLKRTGHKNLCTAGGVFLNVKVNQRIREAFPDVNYWPFPLASDTGLSIGAAMLEYHKVAEYKPERIKDLYWGNEYSNDEIKRVLDLAKLRYRPYNVEEVAGMLADNKIVAWFQGRMEAGPRALGNRSILMSPLSPENKDIINRDVKFREAFRPFCPSVTEESHPRYFDGGGEFMITACNVKKHLKGKDIKIKEDDEPKPIELEYYSPIPAVTHVDGTARPQIVRKEVNPKFHALLETFGAKTGHPVLLNTSLNVMGEPIVRTPQEAIRCFFGVGLDVLVIGEFVVEKTGGVQ